MSINNISTEAEANATENVNAGSPVETVNNASIHNGNAIASISYTAGQGVPKNQDVDSQNFLKTVENFGQIVNAEEIPNEVFEQICDNTKGVLTVLPEAIKEVCVQGGMTLSKEVTEEDLQIQKQALDIISRLNSGGTISDFDIRELMKLLIKAFSELMNAQREIELNTVNNIIAALETKIAAMEKSRDENYKAAITQAVGQIVSGALQIGAGIVSIVGACRAGGKLNQKTKGVATEDQVKLNSATFEKTLTKYKGITDIINACGTITTGITGLVAAGQQAEAKSADIISAIADALMEVARKMQEAVSSALSKLMEQIAALLQVISSLIQSTSAAEKSIVA